METRGFCQRVGNTYYFFGEIKELCEGRGKYSNLLTNIEFESEYFDGKLGGNTKTVNTISFWNEPERIVKGILFKEKTLSSQIRKNCKVGDKLLLKCYVDNDGHIKAQSIGYPKSCFPIKKEDKTYNLVFGKVYYPKTSVDGRFRFTVPCNALVDGNYENICLTITADCSETLKNLSGRAEKFLKEGTLVLCHISDIKKSVYEKDGKQKCSYSAWLSSFSAVI